MDTAVRCRILSCSLIENDKHSITMCVTLLSRQKWARWASLGTRKTHHLHERLKGWTPGWRCSDKTPTIHHKPEPRLFENGTYRRRNGQDDETPA